MSTLATRKALGAFYTPPALAEQLVRWAVNAQTTRVLDPSFGDGRLLAAAGERLRGLGVGAPGRRLYGVELAPDSDPHVLRLYRVPAGNLLRGDFFATDLSSWDGQRFDAVVGNPPYVRHHLLSAESKALAREHAARVGVTLSERADAWAYFCAALLDYLKPQGRLALLLPGAVLHADYALPVLHAFSKARGRVRLVRVQERLFEDAVERTVVLLLDGRTNEVGVDYREVSGIPELATLLNGRERRRSNSATSIALVPNAAASPSLRLRTRLRWFISPAAAELWERVVAMPEVVRIGDVTQIRIGVVTGANAFFVVDSDRAARYRGAKVRTVPIVSRGAWLRKTRWSVADQHAKRDEPSHLLLIDPRARPRKALRTSIDAFEEDGVKNRSHCGKREDWYCLEDSSTPDLFLPYMGAAPPQLVVNQARATCTNAIHRVTLREGQYGAAAVAAASWTGLYALTAELVGRSYGGGVLKLELGEAAELRLPLLPGGAEHLLKIERARVEAGTEEAQRLADDLLLGQHLGLDADEIELLRAEADQLRRRRGH